MLNWVKPFNIFCLLDNQQYNFEIPAFELLLGVGCKTNIDINSGNAFAELKAFYNEQNDWLFGHLGYDLKNETEQHLFSSNFDGIGFNDLHFFVPEIVIQLNNNELTIFCEGDADNIFSSINLSCSVIEKTNNPVLAIKNRISQEEYIPLIKQIQQHILRGDCYELNFCQEFYAENTSINPISVYAELTALSPNPFAALYKLNDKYCLCASPERYLKKTGCKIISQPIKGTSSRNKENKQLDDLSKEALLSSNKERSENVMKLIEQYEQTKRGIFSGSIGYINPAGDFDFNVVIRSIMYNATTQYLSFPTGGAITFYSDAVTEYEECLLKSAAIKQVLQ
ncbi:MAG: chorismate-binding protein [Sphingobacteriales bacterium]|nr:chorismate-binding protein [Sphingobacteriales bacterium]